MQYSSMPTASADNLGTIVQFTGATASPYTNGYFYKCVSDGEATPTYSWENVNVQDGLTSVAAADVSYDGTATEIPWTNVQQAIDALGPAINAIYEQIFPIVFKRDQAGFIDTSVAELRSSLLSINHLSCIYRITDSGTTTADFID